MDDLNVFERSVINALENYLEYQSEDIKPLSEAFFNKIEDIKQRSQQK